MNTEAESNYICKGCGFITDIETLTKKKSINFCCPDKAYYCIDTLDGQEIVKAFVKHKGHDKEWCLKAGLFFVRRDAWMGPEAAAAMARKPDAQFSHYHKPCPYPSIDVYRVLSLFGINDPCIQHAIKKLLVAGNRGSKDAAKDIAEAIVSLQRWQQMRDEEA